MGSLNEKLNEFDSKKVKYARRIKQLEETNVELQNALEEVNMVNQASFSKMDFDKLIKDNNQLIEKVRALEKEKNQYYSELKSVSPIRERRNVNGDSRRKTLLEKQGGRESNLSNLSGGKGDSQSKQKMEHYSMMERRINQIKSENEQIKANLALR